LRERTILEFSLNAFLHSTDSIEDLVGNFNRLFAQLEDIGEGVILFLDEMQLNSMAGWEGDDRRAKIQGLIKTHLASTELSLIAATTPEYYYKYIKNDETLSASFSPVLIEEPSRKDMLEILAGVRPYFERYYSITIPVNVFPRLHFLAQKFIPHRAFPHKAIDLLDKACSKASLKGKPRLSLEYFYRSVSEISKLPLHVVKLDPYEHSKGLQQHLKNTVVNQRAALEEISRIIKLSRLETDINKTRPEGVFLFLGATGVGKRFAAMRIADYLFGSREKLRVIDLADFKKPGDLKKLIGDAGSGPGILIREVENHPFSVILFENIASAHAAVLSFLGKVVGRGDIVDPYGRRHYLSSIILILNLTRIGETRIESAIGFVKGDSQAAEIVIPGKIMNVLEWVDEIIEFAPLSEEDLLRITREKLKNLLGMVQEKYRVKVETGKAVAKVVTGMALADGNYAHSAARIIERQIRIPLLDFITQTDGKRGLRLDVKSGKFVISRK
jgi:ATP-dependent Clp protease ATP-binding subunit ClpA